MFLVVLIQSSLYVCVGFFFPLFCGFAQEIEVKFFRSSRGNLVVGVRSWGLIQWKLVHMVIRSIIAIRGLSYLIVTFKARGINLGIHSEPLEVYLVVNFRIRKISRGVCKLGKHLRLSKNSRS